MQDSWAHCSGYKAFFPLINILLDTSKATATLDFSSSVVVQVTLEESPDESFFNVSAQQCWEMVLQRVKHTSTNLGLTTLPRLESINGLQMFGLLSQSTVQVKH